MTMVHFVPRHGWLDEEPQGPLDVLKIPMEHVLFTHTDTDSCSTHRECVRIIRKVRAYQMKEIDVVDITYNFLIGGNGLVYEGRGWNTEPLRPALYQFLEGMGIEVAYIGVWDEIGPTPIMLRAARNLIFYGINEKLIKPDFGCTHLS